MAAVELSKAPASHVAAFVPESKVCSLSPVDFRSLIFVFFVFINKKKSYIGIKKHIIE